MEVSHMKRVGVALLVIVSMLAIALPAMAKPVIWKASAQDKPVIW
jgi:hypothetical protein